MILGLSSTRNECLIWSIFLSVSMQLAVRNKGFKLLPAASKNNTVDNGVVFSYSSHAKRSKVPLLWSFFYKGLLKETWLFIRNMVHHIYGYSVHSEVVKMLFILPNEN